MKKAFMVAVLFTAFAFAPEATVENSEVSFVASPDGIGCKIYDKDGTLIAKCFICDCAELAQAVGQGKE